MEIEKNKSRTYIVPIIDKYVKINRTIFLNSYLWDINCPEYNIDSYQGIFLLFKWSSHELLKQYEDELINNKYIKCHYDVDEEHFMVYCEFPNEVLEDCLKIIQGQFSKISDVNKVNILKFWNYTKESKLYGILYKDPKLKKQMENELNVKLRDGDELGSIFDEIKEVFSYNKKVINTIHK